MTWSGNHVALRGLLPTQMDAVAPAAANAGGSGASIFQTLGWLLALTIVGFVAVYAFRRWWMRINVDAPFGFTLSDLREMLEAGDITDLEFRAAREAMIAQVKKQASARGQLEKYTRQKGSNT
ncbi:MAG: hypothetical protein EXS01_06905 [Phycisphaerales bacterium]|nr:hypothetical protein [Phycisphaerales bacterium]